MHRSPLRRFFLSACLVLTTADPAAGAGIHRCSTPDGGSRLARTPCIASEGTALDIDRLAPADVSRPGARSGSGPGAADAGGLPRARPGARSPRAAPGPPEVFPQPAHAGGGPGITGGDAVAAPAPPDIAPRAIVDPLTGRALMPAATGRVDPLTGTLWIRAPDGYVDPVSGRIIPGGD